MTSWSTADPIIAVNKKIEKVTNLINPVIMGYKAENEDAGGRGREGEEEEYKGIVSYI